MTDRQIGRSRYGPYAGGPDPLAPPVDLADALDELGEEVMAGVSPQSALREMIRRGTRDQQGLDDLARRLAERRNELTRRHNLGGLMDEVKKHLDAAVLAERKQLARDLDDDARFAEMTLEALPTSPAAAVTELASYPWRSSEAREHYDAIRDLLGREALDQRFEGMKQALEGATDEDKAAVQEMLGDLNELLEKRRLGEDTPQDFQQFMGKHGDFFPENPRNLDDLLDTLAQRAAAGQRMLNSMTPEQRAELMELSAQAFGSPDLQGALSRLDDNLHALRPGEDWSGSAQFDGEQGVGPGAGTGMLQELANLDALAEQLGQGYAGADLADIDLDALARLLGPEAAVSVERLSELERALRSGGYLQRTADGSLRLSPKAMRRLGKELLKDVAMRLSGRHGSRDARLSGALGEPTGATREWEFGATEPWDVTRTMLNGLTRQAGQVGGTASAQAPNKRSAPAAGERSAYVRLDVRDVETIETEARTQSAVALLVDTSYSMMMEGRWVPMKRTALALHHLVSTRFRGDKLQLVSFGRHARTLPIDELTALDAAHVQGTNLHHALLLAGRHFRAHPTAQPVLLVVTDGEPTAHLERDGEAFFDYPPHPLTLALTIRELDACVRMGAQTTFFRLGDDPGLVHFLDRLATRAGGRVVAPDLEDLGAAVVGSYLGGRGLSWLFE